MSAQVRAARTSPRRTTKGPIEVVTNLATAPSGPKNWAISALLASTREPGVNGYLAAKVRWKGSTTCAIQVLFNSDSLGWTIMAKVCIRGRTSSGRSACFCGSFRRVRKRDRQSR